MKPYWTNTHLFITGAARFNDLVYLSSQQKNLAEQDIQHSVFIAWDMNKWFQEEHKNWNCAGMCIAKKPIEKLIAVSEDGEVWTYVSGKKSDEEITPKPDMIRGVSTVNGIPCVCGMNRQVYKRLGDNNWHDISAPRPESGLTRGFEDVCGFSENEIYATGWSGEIWFFNGNTWKKMDSPTNLILTCITCGDDGYIYAAGQEGVIIKGRNDEWEVIVDEEFKTDIWDITYFSGKIYLASMQSIYFLHNNIIQPVDFGDDYPRTCNYLTHAEGVLWSIGSADLFSFDGNTWQRIE